MASDGLSVVGGESYADDAKQKKLVLHAIDIGDYSSVRNAALDWERKNRLRTITSCRDQFEPREYEELRDAKLAENQELTYGDLPDREVVEQDPRTKEVLRRQMFEFGLWWIAMEPEGMLFCIWLSCKKEPSQANMTQEQLEKRFMKDGTLDVELLEEAARKISNMSTEGLPKNGPAPTSSGAKKRKKRKHRKQASLERRTG